MEEQWEEDEEDKEDDSRWRWVRVQGGEHKFVLKWRRSQRRRRRRERRSSWCGSDLGPHKSS